MKSLQQNYSYVELGRFADICYLIINIYNLFVLFSDICNRIYTVSQKRRHYTLVHNSFTDVLSWNCIIKLLIKISYFTSDVLLHYLVKKKQKN